MEGYRLLRQFADAKTESEVFGLIMKAHGQEKAVAAKIVKGHNHYPMGSRVPVKKTTGFQAWLPIDRFPLYT